MPIAFGAGSAWVLGAHGVVRLNGATGRVEADISVEGRRGTSSWPLGENVAFADGRLWVESVVRETRGYSLVEVSPSTDRVVRRVMVGSGPGGPLNQGLGANFQTMVTQGPRLLIEHRNTVMTVNAVTAKTLSVVADRHPPVFVDVDGADVEVAESAVLAAGATS